MVKQIERIIPEREFCECGRKVLNHHWLCDICWGIRAKEKAKQEKSKDKPKIKKIITFQVNTKNEMLFLKCIIKVNEILGRKGIIHINNAGKELLMVNESEVEEIV